MPSGFTRRDLKTELLENLWQVAEHRRVDQNNVVLRSARRHFKTVKVVYTRQAVSEPAPHYKGAALCCTDQQLGEVSPRHLLS